ncbi:sulfatase [candidate division KSB1 bacterium]|nr:sulfatase [candidate division KSB1 bacterium]
MNRRDFLKKSSLAALGAAAIRYSCTANQQKRPNILFVISDDQSWPYASIYGCPFVNTPAFDRVAREGVLFNNVFACAPQCSPNRASILTGRHIWQNEEAGTHASLFPKKLPVFTDELEKSGYVIGCTGKGWGPGDWKRSGWEQNPAGPPFDEMAYDQPPQEGIRNLNYAANFEAFLNQRDKNRPFFFWYGASEPHRPFQKGCGVAAGKNLADVTVPAFLPDHPEIRSDILDYAVEIEWFDQHLDKMLNLLDERGEIENTLIIVTSDNGMPFPRAKANLYEYGIHMPFAVRWGDRVPAHRRIDDLFSFIDVAPTLLDAAGVPIPQSMRGTSFLNILLEAKPDQSAKTGEKIFAGRERHTHARLNNWCYPSRCIRTDRYLYIWNMKRDRWPAGDPTGSGEPEGYHDIDACPSKTFLLKNREQFPGLAAAALDKRPEEELFDIRKDPYCMTNVAEQIEFQEIKKQLRAALEKELAETGDPRLHNSEVFESYPRVSRMRNFPGFKKQGEYNPDYQ